MANTDVSAPPVNLSGTLGVYDVNDQPGGISPAVTGMSVSCGFIVCSITYTGNSSTLPTTKYEYEAKVVYGVTTLGSQTAWLEIGDDWVFAFSIEIAGSHIDRTEAFSLSMGSDTGGPTHSVEREFVDQWEADPSATYSVTMGGMGGSGAYSGAMPNVFGVQANMHKGLADGTDYAKWTGMQWSAFALNFSGKYIDAGTFRMYGDGSSVKVKSLSNGAGNAILSGGVSIPYAVNFSKMGVVDWQGTAHNTDYDNLLVWVAGLKKVSYMGFTWPDKSETETGGSGFYADGDSCPVRLGELRSLAAPYVQAVAPYSGWSKDSGYTIEFWDGGILDVRVDQVSARAHKIPTHAQQYLIMGVPSLTATDCTSDPHWDATVGHVDVDVDLSGAHGSRATAWTSPDFVVTGGGVGTSGNLTFTVPTGGGTLERSLQDNWLPRCAYYISQSDWAVFPQSYYYRENNAWKADYGQPYRGYTSPDEDVSYWLSHRYLEIGLTPTGTPTLTAFVVRVKYKTDTVIDNHSTSSRSVTCSLSSESTETYNVTWKANRLWIDLWNAGNAPRLEHVTKIEIDFPAEERDWELDGVWLRRHSDSDPDRSEVIPHGFVTAHEVRRSYNAGGVRAVMDGLYERVLCFTENYSVWGGQERVCENIAWAFGALTDDSEAWGYEKFLRFMSRCTEGWTWTEPADWNTVGGMRIDADSNMLTTGYSFDLAERQDYGIDGGSYPCRFAAYKWSIVRGIEYRPWAIEVVQGGLHGLSTTRNATGIKLYRRATGGSWILLRSNITTDGHGYWWSGEDVVELYDGTTPDYWEYRISGTEFARIYERQWVAALLVLGEYVFTTLDHNSNMLAILHTA